MNNKGNIGLAYQQFISDLRSDKDFLTYRNKCALECGRSYGVVVVGINRYTINKFDRKTDKSWIKN